MNFVILPLVFCRSIKMRGGARGRSARGGRSGPYKPKVFIPRVPFDIYVVSKPILFYL